MNTQHLAQRKRVVRERTLEEVAYESKPNIEISSGIVVAESMLIRKTQEMMDTLKIRLRIIKILRRLESEKRAF